MVEVVFGNAEKGAMKCAQHFSGKGRAAFFPILREGAPPLSREEYDDFAAEARLKYDEEQRRGRPLGGDAGDVLALPFALDMGDIGGGVTGAARRELLTAMYADHSPPHVPGNPRDGASRQIDGSIADYQSLLARAESGEALRIWYSDMPGDLCGLYSLLFELGDRPCPVSAVKFPGWTAAEGGGWKAAAAWGAVSPGDFAAYLPLEREVPANVRRAVSLEWARLREENAPLRAVVSGRPHSVNEDFYDPFIRSVIPDGPFNLSRPIVDVMTKYSFGIGDWFIAKRIQHFTALGGLRLIREEPFYNHSLFEKTASF